MTEGMRKITREETQQVDDVIRAQKELGTYVPPSALSELPHEFLSHRARQLSLNPNAPLLLLEPAAKSEIDISSKPVEMQREMAVRLRRYIDDRMHKDILESGKLSSQTRTFIELYNEICDRVHRNTFGDKAAVLHLHKVSHGQIASMVRQMSTKDAQDADVLDVSDLPKDGGTE